MCVWRLSNTLPYTNAGLISCRLPSLSVADCPDPDVVDVVRIVRRSTVAVSTSRRLCFCTDCSWQEPTSLMYWQLPEFFSTRHRMHSVRCWRIKTGALCACTHSVHNMHTFTVHSVFVPSFLELLQVASYASRTFWINGKGIYLRHAVLARYMLLQSPYVLLSVTSRSC